MADFRFTASDLDLLVDLLADALERPGWDADDQEHIKRLQAEFDVALRGQGWDRT